MWHNKFEQEKERIMNYPEINEVKHITKADRDFYLAIKEILNEQQFSLQARPVYKDGSTANSLYINGYYNSFDLSKGEFPITTLRPIAWKSAIKEILWIYQDQSNSLELLRDKYNVTYWDAWEVEDTKTIGERYGAVVKKHGIIDKILKQLEENPWNRRNVISLWDYESFDSTDGLLPCAFLTMFDVRTKGEDIYLDCTLTQRSNDMLVAHHINAIQYVALQMMIACHFGWKVGKFNYFVNNLHIYDNQLEQAEELLNRFEAVEDKYLSHLCKKITKDLMNERKDFLVNDDDNFTHKVAELNELVSAQIKHQLSQADCKEGEFPKLVLNCPPKTNFYDIRFEDFSMEHYNPIKPQIKFDDLAI